MSSLHRSGAGDPARSLRLLWRERLPQPQRRGRRPGLNVEAVIDAATRLAGSEGLAALTMRRLAAELGVGPMTLYRYVPGKAELLDLIVDAAYGRQPRPDLGGLGWRGRLRRVADLDRELHLAHPWLTELTTTRPPLGPGLFAKYEFELGALAGCGLDDLEIERALGLVQALARASARDALAAAAERDGAADDSAWWAAAGPLLASLVRPQEFPLATAIGTAAGEAQGGAADPDAAYEFAIERALDGLQARIGVVAPPRPAGERPSPAAGTLEPRRAGAGEAGEAAALLREFNLEFGEPSPPAATLARRLRALLAEPGSFCLLAGRPARGVALVRLRPGIWEGGLVAYLEELYVEPSARGAGAGRRLLEAALEAARAAGARSFELTTAEADDVARRLYESCGFSNAEGGPDGPPMLYYERSLSDER